MTRDGQKPHDGKARFPVRNHDRPEASAHKSYRVGSPYPKRHRRRRPVDPCTGNRRVRPRIRPGRHPAVQGRPAGGSICHSQHRREGLRASSTSAVERSCTDVTRRRHLVSIQARPLETSLSAALTWSLRVYNFRASTTFGAKSLHSGWGRPNDWRTTSTGSAPERPSDMRRSVVCHQYRNRDV